MMKVLVLIFVSLASLNSHALRLVCAVDEVRGTIQIDADSSCASSLSTSLGRDVRACVESKEALGPGTYQVCGKLDVAKNIFSISQAVDERLR